jgi:hypothetical protein
MGFITSLPMAKDTEMVKLFFTSVGRLFFLAAVFAVIVYGIVQAVTPIVTSAAEINKWLLLTIAFVLLYSVQDIMWDVACTLRSVKKSLNNGVDSTEE